MRPQKFQNPRKSKHKHFSREHKFCFQTLSDDVPPKFTPMEQGYTLYWFSNPCARENILYCALPLILFGAFICDEWSRIIIMSRSADRRQYAIVVDDPSDMLFRIDQEC